MDDVVKDEVEMLRTRAKEYVKLDSFEIIDSAPKPKRTARNKNFFLCKEHHKLPQEWKEENNTCSSCLKFEIRESLPLGVLPSRLEVLEYLLTVKFANTGCNDNFERKVSKDVVLQWVFCNVYPKDFRTVENDLVSFLGDYKSLKKRSTSKKSDEYWMKYERFVCQQKQLFDIVAMKERIKLQEIAWGVKMCEDDWVFYNQQRQNPRKGYCTTCADKKWEISNNRKLDRLNRSYTQSYPEDYFKNNTKHLELVETESEAEDQDDVFIPEEPEKKRPKYQYVPVHEQN